MNLTKKNTQQTTDPDDQATVVDPEELEKSWTDSIDVLKKALGGEEEDSFDDSRSIRRLKKAKKAMASDYEEEDEEEEEEEEEEPSMKKSLEDYVAEEDPEAELAMDAEPFLKSLVAGVEQFIENQFKGLKKSIDEVTELAKAQGKVILQTAELQKSNKNLLVQIGDTPIPSSSILMKGGDRFGKGEKPLNRAQILQKSSRLLQEGKIDIIQATKIEGRVNKGLPLMDDVAHLFEEGGDK